MKKSYCSEAIPHTYIVDVSFHCFYSPVCHPPLLNPS